MRVILYIFIGLMLIHCSPPPTIVQVEVTDKISEKPLDSVSVQLWRELANQPVRQQARSVQKATFVTNSEGKCQFTFEAEDGYGYRVIAERRHFRESVSADGGEYENQAVLEPGDTNVLHLYLEAILPPDPERFTRMHDSVPVNQLLAAIVADEWSWSFLPRLSWQDIPALLQMGADTTYIQNYPRHPLSTYRPDSVRAGLVALWLIEAIRKGEIREVNELSNLMPPSRAPALGTRRGNPSGRNSPDQVSQAYQGYSDWWEEAQQLERKKAIRKNPLRGKAMSWM